MNEIDVQTLSRLVERGADSYMDHVFKTIITHIDYNFATIVTLTEALQNAGKRDCLCLDIYRSNRQGE